VTAERASDPAVALFIYDRPAQTRRVFERIRAARPRRLFVIADGPRSDADAPRVAAARAVTAEVDWPCEVERDYAEVNLGCGRRVASGIEATLAAVEEAIFLEDDCLPDLTFFGFCAELLERYREEPAVMMVSGFNPLAESAIPNTSYALARVGSVWGWASWRRAFQGYDRELRGWRGTDMAERLRAALADDAAYDHYRAAIEAVLAGQVDTWDYQWTVHRLLAGGLTAVPAVNAVENIGFDATATHTRGTSLLNSGLVARSIAFPLRHPASASRDPALDARLLAHRLGRPAADDLLEAIGRLLLLGHRAPSLALATAGADRYPADARFGLLRIEALEGLGQVERASRERSRMGLSDDAD